METILLPDLGDFQDVEIVEMLVKEGDTVEIDDPLLTLETEKAAMDLPCLLYTSPSPRDRG